MSPTVPILLNTADVRTNDDDEQVRACWERNLNMSSDSTLIEVLTEAGYDGLALLKRSNESDIKSKLRESTKEAKDSGICGVPTYRVFRRKVGEGEEDWKQAGDFVWGQDELNVVEDLISGWDGEGVARVGGGEGRESRL